MTLAKVDDIAIIDNAAANFLQQQPKAVFKTIHEPSQKAPLKNATTALDSFN
jgi:hypothetical protein